ncbi:anti-sigma-28 factor, FlgM [Clostridium acetireducens DSM 10703]|jgi:negative regulator of flagellin synthesis FlgM|uniref:Anti-sigma-28 factor, FlgM n=1 Tax=Clostridium acetireducens DSM 10703 TaxID=1121290 RepID=A0A1E8F062_9CLOT|nr:flagellar biosynthesis anti-sigma factor FlgM [Clostridium acetireducens]OFI06512.1 anti-sigma-28 factor, FlgM [Clostridium acetireducens DSM 10703]
MKINGVNINKIINSYNNNNKVDKKQEISKKDSVEISNVGKSLSAYSINENFTTPKEKIEKLKQEVSKGTYKRDAKLVAEKIIQTIKQQQTK